MKVLTSRVVVSAIASFIAFAIVPAIATTPEADFKTVTSKAYVDSLISNNDISGHKVNGVALSNSNITLYGRSSTGATTAAKAVKVYNSAEGDVTIGALSTGMVIVVKPTYTATTTAPTTLNVNSLGAKPMRYNGAAITVADAAKVWNKDNPSIWVYDGTNWNFAGGGKGADNLVWGASETTSTNAYDTTFVGDTGATANAWPAADKTKIVDTSALANALALKQNKIDAQNTSLIPGQQVINGVPSSVIAPTDAPGVVQQVALWDADGGDSASWDLETAYGVATERSAVRQSIPTVGSVEVGLALKQNKLPAKNTGDLAPKGNQAVVLDTAGNPSNVYTTAGKNLALTARPAAQKVMNYVDGTTTLSTFATNQGLTQAQVKSALVSLELLKDVYSEINAKITNNSLPTGTTGTVVTYNGTNAQTGVQQFTETAIVDAPDYTGTGGSLVNGDSITSVEYVENALATKQPIIQPSTVNGKTQIVVKPAYGGNAGEIGYLTLDTSSLTTGNDSTVPSSKLLNTLLGGKYDTDYILDTGETDIYASDYSGAPSWATKSGTANLYRFPGAVNGDNWASKVLYAWSSKQHVPTMDTLANSLAGLYDAVGDLVDNQILDYGETGSDLFSASVPVPTQIEYAGAQFLGDGNQLFWLPQLASNGVQEATQLLKYYSNNKIVPSMDELAYALDGVLQTHETAEEWQAVASAYHVGDIPLFMIRDKRETDANVRSFYRSGYLQTFAPTLDALAEESFRLYKLIDAKQDRLSGTSGNLVTYGTTAGSTGSKAIATSISNNANTVPNTQAVYNAVNARQNVIPVAGKYRSSNTATTDTTISDWTATNIKGTALVTKPTSSNGVVGERKIFEAGTTYTNDAATNIQIATIGAVMENTVTKRCVGYKPGTLPANENASTCWLWEFVSNSADSGRCIAAGDRCRDGSDCCSGNCVNGLCSALGFDDRDGESVGSKS